MVGKPRGMTDLELRGRVQAALEKFLAVDGDLLERNAAERAMGACFANHLRLLFSDYHVDAEYDRHGFDSKALNLPPQCRGGGRRLVVPDIVIHRRGRDDNNLLVIES